MTFCVSCGHEVDTVCGYVQSADTLIQPIPTAHYGQKQFQNGYVWTAQRSNHKPAVHARPDQHLVVWRHLKPRI